MRSETLKGTWLRKIVLLTMLTVGNSIVFSQASSIESDSLKCFSIKDSKLLLSYAEKGYFCDTLITAYEKKVKALENVSYLQNEELQLSSRLITSQMMQIKTLNRKVQNFKILTISLGVVATLELIYILNK